MTFPLSKQNSTFREQVEFSISSFDTNPSQAMKKTFESKIVFFCLNNEV